MYLDFFEWCGNLDVSWCILMYLDVIDVSGLILKILWNDVFYLCGDMCLDQWLWFLWHLCFLDVTTPAISFTSNDPGVGSNMVRSIHYSRCTSSEYVSRNCEDHASFSECIRYHADFEGWRFSLHTWKTSRQRQNISWHWIWPTRSL